MGHREEQLFLERILRKMHLQITRISSSGDPSIIPMTHSRQAPDMGLRQLMGQKAGENGFFHNLPGQSSPRVLYKLTDMYLCHYLYLLLPEEKETVLLVGPYMTTQLTREQLLQEAERFAVPPRLFPRMETCYAGIPVLLEESGVLSIMNAFAETLWGGEASWRQVNLTEEELLPSPMPQGEASEMLETPAADMEAMERRYAYEHELLQAVSLGLTHKAEMLISHFSRLAFQQRVADPVRNIKNYCIIMNTLMRKAAEQGTVHPLYLDRVSSDLGRKIEQMTSVSNAHAMMMQILHTYCRLVNKHTMKGYSQPVRNMLVHIESNLSGDLSLHTLAALQQRAPGYLSGLFRKETGMPLTAYVHRARMTQASHLLGHSALQIQTIAQHCGFQDVNHFSKTFKHIKGETPTAYRRRHRKAAN